MWRTRVDIPEFTRCCFCIPLRYGILTWAYIKVGTLIIAAMEHTDLAIELDPEPDHWDTKVFIILICVVIYLDIMSTIFCIVVGHLKHRRGLTLYFYVSLIILIAYITIQILFTLVDLIKFHRYGLHRWTRAVAEIFMTVLSVAVQMYILFLVRSEILKLSAPPNLRFVNHDVEQGGKSEVILEEREYPPESRTGDDAFTYTY